MNLHDQLLVVFYDTIESINPSINMVYDGSVDTWCSDKFLFPVTTNLSTTLLLASHVDCFRPYILVSDVLSFSDSNFTVIDLDTLTTIHTEGVCKPLDSTVLDWITKNKINLIDCWLQENTIIPLLKDYEFEHI